MHFHIWYIPAYFAIVFTTGYLWGAGKALGFNDWKGKRLNK